MIGRLVWLSRRQLLQQQRDREFEHLQTRPEIRAGIVWGCAKWRKCGDRVIETPPYGDDPPYGRCGGHGLRMDTKVVESRVFGSDGNGAGMTPAGKDKIRSEEGTRP